MITIQARLKISETDAETLDDLMKRQSSCMRYAYQRLLEGKKRIELKRNLQELFNLNSRYVDDAISEAQEIINLSKKLNFNPKKVIFGGKPLFKKLYRKHLSERQRNILKQEWKDKRQGNLYARGDNSKDGNLNLRVVKKNDNYFLRINISRRNWLFVEMLTSHKKWSLFESKLHEAYSVRILRRNGKYYCYISFEEELTPEIIKFDDGAIGVDLNAFPSNISWVEIDKEGNLKSFGKTSTPHLWDGKRNKRDPFAWQYAHKIVEIAKEKGKGIVLEFLKFKNKGYKGDYKGRKSRRIKHNFSYRKLKEKIIILAKRNGIAIKQVNPAYTSIIGILKYAPQWNLTKDVAAGYVIARRGLGFGEKIPKNYKSLQCEPETVSEPTRGRSSDTAESLKRPLYNSWRALKTAVLTAPFPEKHLIRCFSPLKSLLVSGDMGRALKGVKSCNLEQGLWTSQIPPAEDGMLLKGGLKIPQPQSANMRFE